MQVFSWARLVSRVQGAMCLLPGLCPVCPQRWHWCARAVVSEGPQVWAGHQLPAPWGHFWNERPQCVCLCLWVLSTLPKSSPSPRASGEVACKLWSALRSCLQGAA